MDSFFDTVITIAIVLGILFLPFLLGVAVGADHVANVVCLSQGYDNGKWDTTNDVITCEKNVEIEAFDNVPR